METLYLPKKELMQMYRESFYQQIEMVEKLIDYNDELAEKLAEKDAEIARLEGLING